MNRSRHHVLPARASSLAFAFAVVTTVLCAMPTAWAQQPMDAQRLETQETLRAGGAQWGLGIGAVLTRKPYRDFTDKAQVLPLILYANKYVSVLGPGLDVNLPSAGPVALRLRVRYANDGYKAGDSAYLAGMEDRKTSFWLGGAAIWRNDIANLSAELLADGSGNSKGTRFKLQLDRRFTYGAIGFTPRVAAEQLDQKYVDYYYGVRATEVRSGRVRYEGQSAVNMEVGVRMDYAIAPKQALFVDLSGTSLGNGIKNSPLVARSSSSAVRAGYIYRF
jgi:outer membrane protein